jgi:hypothetical protein
MFTGLLNGTGVKLDMIYPFAKWQEGEMRRGLKLVAGAGFEPAAFRL